MLLSKKLAVSAEVFEDGNVPVSHQEFPEFLTSVASMPGFRRHRAAGLFGVKPILTVKLCHSTAGECLMPSVPLSESKIKRQ